MIFQRKEMITNQSVPFCLRSAQDLMYLQILFAWLQPRLLESTNSARLTVSRESAQPRGPFWGWRPSDCVGRKEPGAAPSESRALGHRRLLPTRLTTTLIRWNTYDLTSEQLWINSAAPSLRKHAFLYKTSTEYMYIWSI